MNEYTGQLKIKEYNIHKFPIGVKTYTCPICSASRKKKTDKCVKLFWEEGFAKCFHCGEVIQLHEWDKHNKEVKYKIPEWSNETKLSENVVKWFENRGISQFILRLMKIGEGIENMPHRTKDGIEWKKKNTIQFPYFRHGEIIDIKYRSGDKTFKLFKEAERMAYNLDNIKGQEIIYCVEGEPDVLAVMECGLHNVTSPPNGFNEKGDVNLDWLNNDVEHFINAKKLILAFDNDKPGENGKREFIRRFGAHKCFIVDLKDCKDSNEYLIKYGAVELKKALETHIEIPLENVSTYNDYKERVRDFFLNGMPKGFVTGNMKGLDEIFSINTTQIIVVTGRPSSGKSEVVDQICMGYALKYDHKIAFASIENKPNELHHQKLLRKLIGITPTEKSHFNKSFEACEEFEEDHVCMIDLEGSYDLERVLLKAEELVYRKGIRVLVIDPFNKVRYKGEVPSITGNRTNDYTNIYLTKIEDFARKFDVIPILVAHPVKLQKGDNGKRIIPDMYDIKGGGEFYDMCPHGLVVDRDYDLGFTLVRTLKVKFSHLGESNKDSWFKYNVNNGRYDNVIGDPTNGEEIKIEWDNENWVTKDANKTEQLKLPDNSDLETNPDLWITSKIDNEEEAPF